MPGTFVPIISYTVPNQNYQFITLNNIPQNYTDLYLVTSGTGVTGGGSVWVQLNGDTGSNYTQNFFWSNSSSTNTGNASSTNGFVGRIDFTSAGQNGGGYAYFLNYSNTSYYKTWLAKTAQYNITLNGFGSWRNTLAITSIRFGIESGSFFDTGFRFDLYGILRA